MNATDGRMLGRYQLLFMLGQGGMGEVHLARLTGAAGFEKLCIVKTVLPNLMGDQSFIDRFHHEARVLVQLTHSNIAQVYDMGDVEGTLYMAIEYVAGVDLSRVETRVERSQARMPVPIALYIAQQINEALGYAHRKVGPDGVPLGIVHRDVSPQNVMVSYEGEVKVIDFGLAKSTARSKHTLPSTVMGKLGYMSPEQALAKPVDHRSDIFSAGIVVWEMLAGRSMYAGGTMSEMVAQMAMAEVPSLREARPDISETLEQVVMRALARDPAARYQRADDFARALNELAVREQMTVGAEDVGNYVRAMCPEEFAAERQLQSKLSVLRKGGAREEPKSAEPEIEGTFMRPSSAVQNPSGTEMTPAQRAMSMVAPTPKPGQLATNVGPKAKSLAPQVQSPREVAPPTVVDDAPVVAPKSKMPLVIAGLVAFIALAGAGIAFMPHEEAAKPVVEAPVDAGAPAVAAVVEPPPQEPVKPVADPVMEAPEPEPKKEPVVLETITVDGKVWKVLRKGDEDLLMLDKKDKLATGDRLNLVGDALETDGKKRPLYAHAAVLSVNGSLAKLLFDEDVPLPEKLYASKDAAPRPVAVVRKEPVKTNTAEPVKQKDPEPAIDPSTLAVPEPVKAEPVKTGGPTQLFGAVRLSVPNVFGNRAVVLMSQNNFPLTDCEVRLPSNVFFKFKKPIAALGKQKLGFNDFRPDSRPADPQFKADWSAVYCKEGTGYWKTTYDRR